MAMVNVNRLVCILLLAEIGWSGSILQFPEKLRLKNLIQQWRKGMPFEYLLA